MIIKSKNYHDYVIKDGKFIGKFEEMYQNIEDPWFHGDADAPQYEVILYFFGIIQDNTKKDKPIILDIGCGKGAFTYRLKKKYPESKIIAIDISSTAIWKAKEKYGKMGIDFIVLDILNDELPNKKFDIIVISELFWYILHKINRFIIKIHSALDKDGIVIINQTFYGPNKQKYGNEIMTTPEDLKKVMDMCIIKEEIIDGKCDDFSYVALLKGR